MHAEMYSAIQASNDTHFPHHPARQALRQAREWRAALERIWSPTGSLLTAKDILAEFPCSRRNAEIRFKKTTGRSILQELMSARLERSKALLSQTSLPIPEIAAYCGYKFPAHFRNAFRAATGLNPLAWRKQNLKNA